MALHTTVECRYNAVTCVTILHSALRWQWQNVSQILDSQKTPHTSPSWARYGVSFVRILKKIDRVITALQCIKLQSFLQPLTGGHSSLGQIVCCLRRPLSPSVTAKAPTVNLHYDTLQTRINFNFKTVQRQNLWDIYRNLLKGCSIIYHCLI